MQADIGSLGYASLEEIAKANGWPSQERFSKGPAAIIECVQEIPCNPCEEACPAGAIRIGSVLTGMPRIDFGLCTGCGRCLAACPGLAIFLVDKTYGGGMGSVTFPFEYLPLPEKGDTAEALDRGGKGLCDATVVRVSNPKGNDHTPLVTVIVPLEFVDTVRSIRRPGTQAWPSGFSPHPPVEAIPDDLLVCRCEEVTAGDVRRAIREHAGMSVTGIKHRVRSGMGLCQGKTCGRLVTRILMEETNQTPDMLRPAIDRPPVRPVTFEELAEDGHE